jgi:DNA-binding NtrC family response regulator
MDLEMPLLNGVEASREIMELDPQTSILLVTGSPDSHLAQEALEKRLVRAVIPKPFELHQLKVAIENAVKKARPPSIQKIKARLSFVIFAISAKIEHNLEFTGNEIRGLKECLSQIRDDFLKVD